MNSDWSLTALLILVGTPFLLCLASLAFSFYLSRRHLDDILAALRNSRYVVMWTAGLGTKSWLSRMMLVTKVSGLVMWPGPGLRTGMLDADELQKFPARLNRLLAVKWALYAVMVFWWTAGYVVLEFFKANGYV